MNELISTLPNHLFSVQRRGRVHERPLNIEIEAGGIKHNSTVLRAYLPTLVVGIMITDSTPIGRLEAFRKSFSYPTPGIILKHFFVKGVVDWETRPFSNSSDVIRVDMMENMNAGKTFHWIRMAAMWLKENAHGHILDGIVKMDIDTAVNWTKFATDVFPTLPLSYYTGRRNGHEICGGAPYCPPTGCADFTDECWIYMSGGWYAMSMDVAWKLTMECLYASSNMDGFEDLQVGVWIRQCGLKHVNIKSVDNGFFFCHHSGMDDATVASGNYGSLTCKK